MKIGLMRGTVALEPHESYTNGKKIMIDKILKQAEEWRKGIYKY